MDRDYYQMGVLETERVLKADRKKGLSQDEVYQRQRKYGENRLPEKRSESVGGLILNQFNDFMVILLLGATFFSAIFGHYDDAIVIMAIVILNAFLGFIQEYKAERALEDLKDLSAPKSLVKRDYQVSSVSLEDLVPGDLIILESGSQIPADGRIVSSHYLKMDESSLTGEAKPVKKSSYRLEKEVPLADRSSMVYRGTMVVGGRGEALVTKTGLQTEMGHIAHLIQGEEEGYTPLQWRLKRLGLWLVSLCLFACGLVVFMGIWQGKSIYEMIMAGVSLAVAAIPEGLPAIVTLSLALGVQRMMKKKAIVRRLPAVETLGCATVICTDKTGTLTQNRMSLERIYDNEKTHYEIRRDKTYLLLTSFLCNNASKGDKGIIGDPTEVALFSKALELGLKEEEYRRLEEFPFSSKRRMMSVVVKGRGVREIHSKGAFDIILKRCSHYLYRGQVLPIHDSFKERIRKEAEKWGQESFRVLALAFRPLKEEEKATEEGLTFLGLVGMMDPPRPEVRASIRSCFQAGILPVMITGDHPETALAIGQEIGLVTGRDQLFEGGDLHQKDLPSLLKNIRIFARVSPEEKLSLVKAYQSQGEVVAMTGDGINDAPAVKAADIGIAMGRTGTDVTREVSSLVLSDDNFATIVRAIEEGRGIYDNIRKFIRYLLSCNIGEILLVLIAMLLGRPLPLIPIQILWVNLVTDGLPALALGMEPLERDIMERKPRDPKETIFSHGLMRKILIQGGAIGFSTLLIFLFSLSKGLLYARTMTFTTLVSYQLLFVFTCRCERKPFWQIDFFTNPYLLLSVILSFLLQLLVIYHPLLSRLFGTTFLGFGDWVLILFIPLAVILSIEVIEYITFDLFWPKLRRLFEGS